MTWKMWDVVAIDDLAFGIAVTGSGEEAKGRILTGLASHLPKNLGATTPEDFVEVARTFTGAPNREGTRLLAEVCGPAIAVRMKDREADHWRVTRRRETVPARTPWGRATRSTDCGSGVSRHEVDGVGRAWHVGQAGTASIPVAMQSPDGWYGREFEFIAGVAMPSILGPSEGLDPEGLVEAGGTRRITSRIGPVSPSTQSRSAQRFFGPDYLALKGVQGTADNLAAHGDLPTTASGPTFEDYAGLDAAEQTATSSVVAAIAAEACGVPDGDDLVRIDMGAVTMTVWAPPGVDRKAPLELRGIFAIAEGSKGPLLAMAPAGGDRRHVTSMPIDEDLGWFIRNAIEKRGYGKAWLRVSGEVGRNPISTVDAMTFGAMLARARPEVMALAGLVPDPDGSLIVRREPARRPAPGLKTMLDGTGADGVATIVVVPGDLDPSAKSPEARVLAGLLPALRRGAIVPTEEVLREALRDNGSVRVSVLSGRAALMLEAHRDGALDEALDLAVRRARAREKELEANPRRRKSKSIER